MFFKEPVITESAKSGQTIYSFFELGPGAASRSGLADDGPVSLFSRGGPAQVRLSEAIARRMDDYGENEQQAEMNLVHTEEGLELWEEARDEMTERPENVY